MSDNLARNLVLALALPDTPLVPYQFERPWGCQHGHGDLIALTFRHPFTGHETSLQFRHNAASREWHCEAAQAVVSDEVMERAILDWLRRGGR